MHHIFCLGLVIWLLLSGQPQKETGIHTEQLQLPDVIERLRLSYLTEQQYQDPWIHFTFSSTCMAFFVSKCLFLWSWHYYSKFNSCQTFLAAESQYLKYIKEIMRYFYIQLSELGFRYFVRSQMERHTKLKNKQTNKTLFAALKPEEEKKIKIPPQLIAFIKADTIKHITVFWYEGSIGLWGRTSNSTYMLSRCLLKGRDGKREKRKTGEGISFPDVVRKGLDSWPAICHFQYMRHRLLHAGFIPMNQTMLGPFVCSVPIEMETCHSVRSCTPAPLVCSLYSSSLYKQFESRKRKLSQIWLWKMSFQEKDNWK